MNIVYQEPNATIYCGHALTELKSLPAESVDCVMTSPPYWGLRTYKTEPIIWGDNHCEHDFQLDGSRTRIHKGWSTGTRTVSEGSPSSNYDHFGKAEQGQFCLKCNAWRGELGLEPTIELYIEHLILIFNEVKRVLKKTGTCWVNLDDSYAGGKGQSGCGDAEYQENRTDATLNKPYHQMGGHGLIRPADGKIGVPAKSLCLIPQRFAIAMVEQGWILRNDIVWEKPNPMPESVKDRFTGSWEHLFFFVKSKRYFFEQQFEPITEATITRNLYPHSGGGEYAISRVRGPGEFGNKLQGRNKRDVWEFPTISCPFPGVHFATFPEKLCETPILAGCPGQICKKCGKAREKIYKNEKIIRPRPNPFTQPTDDRSPSPNDFGGTASEFVGYTDCGCNAGFESGVVLDPFMGSGTTLAVAKRLGRKGIGIDISPDYCKLAVKRIQGISLPMELSV